MTQYLQTSHYTWSLSLNRDDTLSTDLTLHLKSLFEQGWHSIYRPHITLEVSLWTRMTQYLQTSHYTWSLSLNRDDTVSTDLTLHLNPLWTRMTQYLQTSHYTWSLSLNRDDTLSTDLTLHLKSLWTRMTQYLQTSHYTWNLSLNRDDTLSTDLTLHLKSLFEQGWHIIYRPHITLEVSLWTWRTQYLETYNTLESFLNKDDSVHRHHITLKASLNRDDSVHRHHITLKASLNRDDNVHRHHIKPKVIFLAPLIVFPCEMSLVKGAISDFIYSRWVWNKIKW
jgi:hypothetical protein